MVQRFIVKLFGFGNWTRQAELLKNTTDDDTPPPGETPTSDTPKAQQPAPGFVSQIEDDAPVAH
jgi:hypothetical protein